MGLRFQCWMNHHPWATVPCPQSQGLLPQSQTNQWLSISHQSLEGEVWDIKLRRGSSFVNSVDGSARCREVICTCLWWYRLLQQPLWSWTHSGLVITPMTPAVTFPTSSPNAQLFVRKVVVILIRSVVLTTSTYCTYSGSVPPPCIPYVFPHLIPSAPSGGR